ncbi:MAG: nicotinamide-nucleotide amidohydrolase family protein, partial [Saprospiraceae bacterium]
KDGKVLISMPGVPYEMKHIMEVQALPLLVEKYKPAPILHRTLLTAGYGETNLASEIEDIESNLPEQLKIAYLPNLGQVRLRLSYYGKQGDSLELMQKTIDKYAAAIQEKLGNKIFGTGTESLEEVLGKRLMEKGMTLATAESCTGGSIAARIVGFPGSSRYFQGGIVAYSNEIKMKQLNVKSDTLENHGAVSEETVKEMVQGAIDSLGVDVAVSVSGIAGPDGGTEEKPVGTIWMAVGNKDKIITEKLSLGKYRLKNIEYTTKRALNLVRLFLADL